MSVIVQRGERFLLAAETLDSSTAPLLRKLARPPEGKPFSHYARSLAAPERSLMVIRRQLHGLLTPSTRRRLDSVSSTVSLFRQGHPNMVFYTEEDAHGGTMLCATISDLTAQLRQTLWRQERPAILTSATLAVGEDFRRFKEKTGLLTDSRVTESVARSPFDYQRNCLLYLPQLPPRQRSAAYYDELAKEIAALLDAAQGHALALFTSYAAMSAVKERLPDHGLRYPLFTMGRNAIHTAEQFKANPGSVLLAAGAAWEGFDFPGDCVSLLIIPRLPFAVPDALKEKERENHPSLQLFIRAVVVPEMQIKLKQGFGRAIRTETDTCVVAILDERASEGKRYIKDVLAALPEILDRDTFRAVQEKIKEKTEGCVKREKRPALALKEYLQCECGGPLCRTAGKNRRTDTLYLKCESCGKRFILPDSLLLSEVSRQMAEHDAPPETPYAPSGEVVRLTNAINRGLERPDRPEDIVSLILQGASARYDCCPDVIEYESVCRPAEVNLKRFGQAVSHITITGNQDITVHFK